VWHLPSVEKTKTERKNAMNTFTSSLLRRRRAVWATSVLALGGVLAGVHAAQNSSSNSAIALHRDSQPVTRGQLERASFSDVVKRVSPSVVKITTETKARHVALSGNEIPGFDNPMFRQFFGGRLPEIRQEPMSGLGSGVIISPDGYIVTNNHVVDGADTLTVTLADGRDLTAKVVGRDPQSDLAVVKVDAKDLPAVTVADSSKIEVGDRVLAIGNPFGIGETVTSGIVSAKGRRVGILASVEGYEDFIQTDAAINPGNSGGALVDVDGRLVGINTAILSRSGGFQGVGLAVPANMVSQVADSLVKNGKVVRGYLGVHIQNLTPALAESLNLKNQKGALVADVEPNSPAAKAGIKEGDVITSVNGQPIDEPNRLTMTVSGVGPDTKLNLDMLRDGSVKHLAVTTAERPNSHRAGQNEALSQNQNSDEGVLNGVSVEDIDPAARQQLKLPSSVKGAVITNVDPESASARAGIRPGDVILEINKQPVKSAQDAVELSAKAESKKTLLKLWSHGSRILVVVDESDSNKANS
jgi:serine protease Do